MHEEEFIREILGNPKDDVARQVYADWLEEQGDPVASAKAEYLRTTVELADRPAEEKKLGRELLRWLAARLDKSWLAIVSHLAVENCGAVRQRTQESELESEPSRWRYPLRFDYVCNRGWEQLRTTADATVRYCDDCHQEVHYCDSIDKARDHAQVGFCVAVDLGVARREGDLHRRSEMTMGVIAFPEDLLRERNLGLES